MASSRTTAGAIAATALLALWLAAPPDTLMGVPLAKTTQEETLPESIPDPDLPGRYLWRSAKSMLGADGQLTADAPRFLLRNVADGYGRRGECIKEIARYESWDGVDDSPPVDLEDFVLRSVATMIGTVTAVHPGYMHAAGQMLAIELREESRQEAGGATSVYAFYPAGIVQLGDVTVCRTNVRVPSPPRVGDTVILAPRRPAASTDPLLFRLHYSGFSIAIYPPDGPARLPDALVGVADLKAPRSVGWLARRIAAILETR